MKILKNSLTNFLSLTLNIQPSSGKRKKSWVKQKETRLNEIEI